MPPPPTPNRSIFFTVKLLGGGAAACALIALVIVGPVVWARASAELGSAGGSVVSVTPASSAAPVSSQAPAAATSAAPVPATTAASTVIPDHTLVIPKIKVQAPIMYVEGTYEPYIQKGLESGVVHYDGTALPNQTGNVAIFGHSSNDAWKPGKFKFVFVLLDKLVPGDQAYIVFLGKRYAYQVTGSRVVEATEVSVLNYTPTPTLTLITCTPAGTSLRRLVVTAKLVAVEQLKAVNVAAAAPVPAAIQGVAQAPVATAAAASVTPTPTPKPHTELSGADSVMSGLINTLASLFK